jgi:hypothetical protein
LNEGIIPQKESLFKADNPLSYPKGVLTSSRPLVYPEVEERKRRDEVWKSGYGGNLFGHYDGGTGG